MRSWTAIVILSLAWVLVVPGARTCLAEEADPNDAAGGLTWNMGAMVGDNAAGIRMGAALGAIELLVEPRYDKALASEGDLCTDIRGYCIYNALTADAVANWIGAPGTVELPDGAVYGGVFGGWEMTDGAMEAGWVVGARVDVGSTDRYQLDFATEYQQLWQTWRGEQDRYTVVVGPRLTFK